MESKVMFNFEHKTILSDLIFGLEAAKKLQTHLGKSPSPPSPSSSPVKAETNEILVKQILSSFEKALLLLNFPPPPSVQHIPTSLAISPVTNSGVVPESPASINNGSPRSEDLIDGGQDYIFKSKKRKMLPKWTEKVRISPERGLEGPQDDVFNWRKYGQKYILGAKFPRSYYRCTHRSTQNCWATKQVQRSDADPTVFQVMYRGNHTCSSPPPPQPPSESPEKQDGRPKLTTVAQSSKYLLENLKTNLTVCTNGLIGDISNDVYSFDDTTPLYTNDFGHVEESPAFDVVNWFNPTVEIDTLSFPTFLQESIFY
ncbi:unnamed protein product [Cochlearia groenlandica]